MLNIPIEKIIEGIKTKIDMKVELVENRGAAELLYGKLDDFNISIINFPEYVSLCISKENLTEGLGLIRRISEILNFEPTNIFGMKSFEKKEVMNICWVNPTLKPDRMEERIIKDIEEINGCIVLEVPDFSRKFR